MRCSAALADPQALDRALGEYLTEPKASVWFEAGAPARAGRRGLIEVVLDRRTRMMYDARHVFINGESYRASGRDAALMRALADRRRLGRVGTGARQRSRPLADRVLARGRLAACRGDATMTAIT